jgi:hypothetical protein
LLWVSDHERRQHLEDRLLELADQLGWHQEAIGEIRAEVTQIQDELHPAPARRWVPTVIRGGAAAAALWVATKAKDKVGYVAGAGALAGTAAILALTNPFGGDVNQPEVPSVIGTPTQRPTVGASPPAPLATSAPTVAPTVGPEPVPTPGVSVDVPLSPEGSPGASPLPEPSAPPVPPEPDPPEDPDPEPPPEPSDPPEEPDEPAPSITAEPPEPPEPSPTPSPTEPPSPPADAADYLACVDADLTILELDLCLIEL